MKEAIRMYATKFEMVLSAGFSVAEAPAIVIRCLGPEEVEKGFSDLRALIRDDRRTTLYIARRQKKLDPDFVLGVFKKDTRGRIRYYDGWPDREHPGRRLIACKAVFPLKAACVV